MSEEKRSGLAGILSAIAAIITAFGGILAMQPSRNTLPPEAKSPVSSQADAPKISDSSRASVEFYKKRVAEHCEWLLNNQGRTDWWNAIQSSAQRDAGNASSEQYRKRVADHCEWLLNNQGRTDWWNAIESSARRDAGL